MPHSVKDAVRKYLFPIVRGVLKAPLVGFVFRKSGKLLFPHIADRLRSQLRSDPFLQMQLQAGARLSFVEMSPSTYYWQAIIDQVQQLERENETHH